MELETTRMFGKCLAKGCKHRAVMNTPARRHTDRDNGYRVVHTYLAPLATHPGMPGSRWWSFFHVYDYMHHEARWWDKEVPDDRPRCPEHKVLLRWQQLDTSKGPNPDKRCDGRCRSARGPVCDCPCNGEQHGADNLTG